MILETRINEYNIKQKIEAEKMAKERDRMNTEFMECSRNQTMTDEECFLHIYNEENKTK
jgi:hypothetical protein